MTPKSKGKQKSILIIGIGSPNGDDRIGWEVVDRLATTCRSDQAGSDNLWVLRKAASPHEILDWLEVGLAVHIIDTAQGQLQPIARYRLERGAGPLHCRLDQGPHGSHDSLTYSPIHTTVNSNERLRDFFEIPCTKSSHQLDLMGALELASTLGRTPSPMFLWTIAADKPAASYELTANAEARIHDCALKILYFVRPSSQAVEKEELQS